MLSKHFIAMDVARDTYLVAVGFIYSSAFSISVLAVGSEKSRAFPTYSQ